MLEIYTQLTSRIKVVDNLHCASGIQTPGVNGEILKASSQISLVHCISWINLKKKFVFVAQSKVGASAVYPHFCAHGKVCLSLAYANKGLIYFSTSEFGIALIAHISILT